jgi:hypothetical protein
MNFDPKMDSLITEAIASQKPVVEQKPEPSKPLLEMTDKELIEYHNSLMRFMGESGNAFYIGTHDAEISVRGEASRRGLNIGKDGLISTVQ